MSSSKIYLPFTQSILHPPVLGTRQKKVQRKQFCVILGEPPDAAPHVRWCERERLAAAPYSNSFQLSNRLFHFRQNLS